MTIKKLSILNNIEKTTFLIFKLEKLPLVLLFILYTVLFFISKNYTYFWDNILLTSNDAHRFYWYGFDFRNFLNKDVSGNLYTSIYIPILPYFTALLWKVIAYKLWISHFLTWLSALILIQNVYKLSIFFVPLKLAGWLTFIILLEPTFLSQYVIASPDFFLVTFFMVAVNLILQNKLKYLPVILLLIFTISVRGTFLGLILLLAHFLYAQNFNRVKDWKINKLRILIYYTPAILFVALYYGFYFLNYGWFFKSHASPDVHYILPRNLEFLVIHIAEFVLRSIENGRILIWVLAVIIGYKIYKKKMAVTKNQKLFLTLIILHIFLYIIFVFISQMPFSARYFLPHFTLLSILVISYLFTNFRSKGNIILVSLILFLQITGHFWIYPEPISKSWDNTLAHVSFYDLRKDVLTHLEKENIPYNQVSAGFSIYSDQQFADLIPKMRVIGSDFPNTYFLYSNISNLSDEILTQLDNPEQWQLQKTFSKGFVEMKLYKKTQ